MTNEIVKIETDQLEKVVTESGLAILEGEEIKKSYLPFINQLAEIQVQSSKINFDTPSEIDETIARELRLRTVKIRTGSKDLKDERKKGYLLRGNLEQAAYNLIEASCKLTEDVFVNVEKAREYAERKRLEQLRLNRLELLKPYTEIEPMGLAHMEQPVFDNLLSGFKVAYEASIAAEKKAEEVRIAKEKAEAEAREAQRLENIRLKKEAEEKEKALAVEREKTRKENEERERLAEIERKKQAEILAKQKAESDKKEAELRAKAESERKERERLEKEIEAKRQKAEKEKADQIAAEKKAAKAPDKVKLIALSESISSIVMPEVKSEEAKKIIDNVLILLQKTVTYLNEKTTEL